MKREDARIYIIFHRAVEYGLWEDNALYSPLQVGFDVRFLSTEVRDSDSPESIAEWNGLYAENTGIYWIWKNRPAGLKYVGNCQYRRRLEFGEDFDFDGLFKDYDVIAASPLIVFPNLALQYMRCHSTGDLPIVRDIIEEEYPEYLSDFDQYIMSGRFIFYSNGFVMRSEDYDRYCEFLFNILERFKEIKGWNTPQEAILKIDQEIADGKRAGIDGHIGTDNKEGNGYQHQVPAFLSERLLSLFIRHNFEPNKIYLKPYTKYENI